jgi:hypothetical protein
MAAKSRPDRPGSKKGAAHKIAPFLASASYHLARQPWAHRP